MANEIVQKNYEALLMAGDTEARHGLLFPGCTFREEHYIFSDSGCRNCRRPLKVIDRLAVEKAKELAAML